MVDYSRFDKIGLSDSEDDDEVGPPGVYRVNAGESITIPGRNVTINSGCQPNASGSQLEAKDTAVAIVPATGNTVTVAELTRNGAALEEYLWSQESGTVTVSVFCAPQTRAADVNVSVTETSMTIIVKGQGTLIENREFFSAVEEPQEAEDVDWQVCDARFDAAGRRIVRVTCHKKNLFGNQIVLWWKSFFKGDAQIDPASLKDRRSRGTTGAQSFSDAFREAERGFKEKMKNKVDDRIEVDIS